MQELLHLVANYGLLVVFFSVLVDQGGIPIPAYPALIVTSALATNRGESVWPILAVAMLAALLADLAWFFGGRSHGRRLLRLMCRISLSPDSCVQQTRGIFARWGVPSLMVAKFVPGFAAVATVLAGESRTPMRTFLFYDGIGALLWSAVGIAIGMIFHDAVSDALVLLEAFGHYGALLLGAAVLAFLAWKWRQRRRFVRALRMDRVSPAELLRRMQSGESTLILDVRRAGHRDQGGWIPGSIHVVTLDEATAHAGQEVVVYCDCPDEISAVAVALELRKRGIARVRPLAGGFEGWRDLGNPVATGAGPGAHDIGSPQPRPA